MDLLKEIPVNVMREEPVVAEDRNLYGPASPEEVAAHDNRVRADMSMTDMIGSAMHLDNAAVNLYDYMNRKAAYTPDPNFKFSEHSKVLLNGVDAAWHDKFEGVASLNEAMDLRESILEEQDIALKLADNGVSGFGARMIASAVDIDMVLPCIGPAAKMSKLARFARGAASGVASAAVTETALAVVGETNDWTTVPMSMLMGATLGGAIGVVQPKVGMTVDIVDDANINRPFEWDGSTPKSDGAAQSPELHSAAKDLADNSVDPVALDEMDRLDHVINEYSGASIFSGDDGTLGERSAAFLQDMQTRSAFKEGWPAKVRAALAKGPFADDATRMWDSGSRTMQALAVSLFEFADGAVVNNRSGAMLHEFVFGHTYKVQSEIYDTVVKATGKKKGFKLFDFKGKRDYELDLNKRVYMQANDMMLGRSPKLDDDVADVLAGINDMMGKFRKEGAGGFDSARPVPGFEDLKEKPGYIPLPWHPDRLRAMLINLEDTMGNKKAARERLNKAITQAYMNANPDMPAEVANQVSRALIRRQLAKGDVMDTNIQALLMSDDSRDLLIEALVDNGATKEQAEAMLLKLSGGDVEKSTVSYGKRRTNIDLAGEYEGIKMVDLVDPDLQGVLMRYADTMSKRIALSRHGIDSKRQIVNIKTQIKKELRHMPQADKAETEKFLDYMFEYFEPGTVDKHINPWMRRAKSSVNLSLLSKLCITQGAETGAIIANTGMENFVHASKVMTQAVNGQHKKALLEDFGFLLGNAAYERGLLRSDFAADAALDCMQSSSKLAKTFDLILARGQHFQSMISGYTKVLEAQLNLGAIASANKIFRSLKAGKAGDLQDMFNSMGVTPKSVQALQKLVDDGTIEFGSHGHIEKLNVDKWPMRIREDFGMSSLRIARQMTQRSLAGESMQWLHDPSWSIFGHLQNFALTAMRKQFLRNTGRKDGQLVSLATWGMGTAALAGLVSGLTEGHDITPGYLARRAFTLNNAFGWVAPGIDLFAVMTGLEEYAPGGRYSQEINIPLLSVASRAQGIPGALAGLIPGMEFTKEDKRAMQVVPVVGGAMFMGRVWDAARTDNEE